MPNSGPHTSLFSTDFSPALARLLRTHLPEISGIQTMEAICKLRRIAITARRFKSALGLQFEKGAHVVENPA
jgi:hypothetical protein